MGAQPRVQPWPGKPFVYVVVLPSWLVQQRRTLPGAGVGGMGGGSGGGIGGACADWQRHIRVPVAGFVPHTPDCPIGHGSGHCESLVHAPRLGIGGGGGVSFCADAESTIAAARHIVIIIAASIPKGLLAGLMRTPVYGGARPPLCAAHKSG